MLPPEGLARDTAAAAPWLSIVGIGEDGLAGLGPAAAAAIEGAEVVFGGGRHLALAAGLIKGEARPWPSPFDQAVPQVLALRGRKVCVLASGDPFCYGVGSVLARHLLAAELRSFAAPSAFSLAAARLGWSLPEVAQVSLHGRPLEPIRLHLQPGARVLALTSDAAGPGELARFLTELGFGPTRLTVLEALGGPRERLRTTSAEGFDLEGIDPLNTVALEVVALPGARVLPRAAGLPDDYFEHDGQLTKREIRAVALSSLMPQAGQLLWDVGAGAGSIAIEWLLAHGSLDAIAIEARADRAARIGRNAAALGVPRLRIVQGEAPAALADLPRPDAVFIGGGATDPGVFEAAIEALTPGGRLVANGVTLETESLLIARHAALGGELIRLAVARAAPLAGMTGWRPAMPVTQWSWVKP